jgi:ABC-type antimicrobial peptide transport system permease subunit
LGLVADFGSWSLFTSLGLQIPQEPVNFWFVLIIFAVLFAVSLVFGTKPILSTAKTGPAKAISPTYYFGLDKTPGFKVVSKSGFTMKIALRGLYRHRSATIRIVLCLSTVFLLVTVAVAGGTIASSTTSSWVEKAIGRDIVLIAHKNMTNQYRLLLSKFYEAQKDSQFNYTDERYLISADLTNQLRLILGNARLDIRLVLKVPVSEVQGVILGNTSADTKTVGRNRKGESLMIGVEPQDVLNEWFLEGRFLSEDQASEAIVGDTLAQKMFSVPLAQKIRLFNESFKVVGVCLDPIDNGNVTYVPLKALQDVTGISKPNIIMIKTNASSNREEILDQIRTVLAAVNQEFEVSDLNEILDKSLGFLGYIWSTIMFLPIFSLVAASLCLLGYVMLAINEQKQEFGILRALGARPRTIVKIVSGQSLVVLLSSYAVGIAFGIIITLLILVEEPIVTGYTVMAIAGWLLIGLAATFLSSLYPALRFAKKPILETMSQS